MAWTATITGKDFIQGMAYVSVEYTDGTKTFSETYKNAQPVAGWVQTIVRDKIAQLDAVNTVLPTIAEGPVTPAAPPTPWTDPDPTLTLFRKRCQLLETVKIMIDLGAVTADNAKVVALINWIKTNFTANFDKL